MLPPASIFNTSSCATSFTATTLHKQAAAGNPKDFRCDYVCHSIARLERNQQFSASWHIGLLCAQNVWIFCITMEKLIPSSQDRKPRKPPEQDGSGGLCDVSFPWKDRMSTGLASEFENCPGKLHFLQRLGRKLLGSNHDTCLSGIREYHDDPC